MRISEIRIHNYRQYRNEIFSFNKNKECDLHLVLGQNTLGKTNLLNAIAWCFFFEEPHVGDKYKAQPIVNLAALSEIKQGENLNVKVEIILHYDDAKLTIAREANFNKGEINAYLTKNSLEVIHTDANGKNEWYLNDEGTRLINRLVPHSLQEFFFFDGEQLDTYFISDKKTKIETPIYEISQVGLLNKVIEHLNSVITELKRESGRGHPDLEDLFNKQEQARISKEEIEKEIAQCEEQIRLSDSVIIKKTEILKGQFDINQLESSREESETLLSDLKHEIDDNKLVLKEFIREYTTKINLYPTIRKTLQIIAEKEENGELPPNIDRQILIDSINSNKCQICKRDLDSTAKKSIEDLLENIQISSEVSHQLVKIKGPLEKIIEDVENYPKHRDSILGVMKKLEADEIRIENQLSDIETKLANCSNKEEIKNAINERKTNEKIRDQNVERKAIFGERLRIANDEFNKISQKYDSALLASIDQKELIKNKEFAEHSKELAVKVKNELMDEMRERIQKSTQELFLKLTWRKNTYKKVVLEDNYSMSLIHNDGYECLGSLSAAERALLALSFTLALHDVSGFDSPLVIDTPVARISDINRGKFADVLKDVSRQKELILLLTPSEYSSEISSKFEGCCSTKSILESDDERTSHIRRQ